MFNDSLSNLKQKLNIQNATGEAGTVAEWLKRSN
jgi:hypothetical protein